MIEKDCTYFTARTEEILQLFYGEKIHRYQIRRQAGMKKVEEVELASIESKFYCFCILLTCSEGLLIVSSSINLNFFLFSFVQKS